MTRSSPPTWLPLEDTIALLKFDGTPTQFLGHLINEILEDQRPFLKEDTTFLTRARQLHHVAKRHALQAANNPDSTLDTLARTGIQLLSSDVIHYHDNTCSFLPQFVQFLQQGYSEQSTPQNTPIPLSPSRTQHPVTRSQSTASATTTTPTNPYQRQPRSNHNAITAPVPPSTTPTTTYVTQDNTDSTESTESSSPTINNEAPAETPPAPNNQHMTTPFQNLPPNHFNDAIKKLETVMTETEAKITQLKTIEDRIDQKSQDLIQTITDLDGKIELARSRQQELDKASKRHSIRTDQLHKAETSLQQTKNESLQNIQETRSTCMQQFRLESNDHMKQLLNEATTTCEEQISRLRTQLQTVTDNNRFPDINAPVNETFLQDLRATSIRLQTTVENDLQNNMELIIAHAESDLKSKIQDISQDSDFIAEQKRAARNHAWQSTQDTLKNFDELLKSKVSMHERSFERTLSTRLVNHNVELKKAADQSIVDINREVADTQQNTLSQIDEKMSESLTQFKEDLKIETTFKQDEFETEIEKVQQRQLEEFTAIVKTKLEHDTKVTSDNPIPPTSPQPHMNVPPFRTPTGQSQHTFRGHPVNIDSNNPANHTPTSHATAQPSQDWKGNKLHQFRKDEILTPISEVSQLSEIRNLYRSLSTSLHTYDLPITEWHKIKATDMTTLPSDAYANYPADVIKRADAEIYRKLEKAVKPDATLHNIVLNYGNQQEGYKALFYVLQHHVTWLQAIPEPWGPKWEGNAYEYTSALQNYIEKTEHSGKGTKYTEYDKSFEVINRARQTTRYSEASQHYIGQLTSLTDKDNLPPTLQWKHLATSLEQIANTLGTNNLPQPGLDYDPVVKSMERPHDRKPRPFRYRNPIQCPACKLFGHTIDETICRFTAQYMCVTDYITNNPDRANRNKTSYTQANEAKRINHLQSMVIHMCDTKDLPIEHLESMEYEQSSRHDVAFNLFDTIQTDN